MNRQHIRLFLSYISLCLLAALALGISSAKAIGSNPNGRSDVRHFEYRQLQLGMDANDVARILRRTGQITMFRNSCASDFTRRKSEKKPISGAAKHCIQLITQQTKDAILMVSFVENWPTQPGKSIAIGIAYNVIDSCAACGQQMLQAVRNALGPPTVTDGKGGTWTVGVWCSESCTTLQEAVSEETHPYPKVIVHKPDNLNIFDYDLQKRRDEARLDYLARFGILFQDVFSM